ncbi:hypothetical protein WN51_00647 [Melipona quadrifasciata]|uniref:Uncharacterized protein n=1 Tax=Melipona quadrifasciata TaxID=166423 RepID=A0A0M9A1Z7_9HYME|nr:hypothetical protein WN51_00647 [Melipona quadrifasciata]
MHSNTKIRVPKESARANRIEWYDRILDNVIGKLIAEPGKHTVRSSWRCEEITGIKAEVYGEDMPTKDKEILDTPLQYSGIQETWNSDQLYRMDKETEDTKSKLSECQKECEDTEIEIYNVNQLKDKGTFVLQNVERKCNNLDEEFKKIHCNYMKCNEKANFNETVQQRINSLISQRDNLKRELDELKKAADKNNKELIEIQKMITIQEKKNMALARKLKKMVENIRITPELSEKVNTILADPRLTNIKNSN